MEPFTFPSYASPDVRAGLPYETFRRLAKLLGLTQQEAARLLLYPTLLLCSGCSLLVYAPGPHQLAFPEEAGETAVAVQAGAGYLPSMGPEAAVQVVHAPADHVLVHGALSGSLRERYRLGFGEAGAGFYGSATPRLPFEVLGAYGRGWFRSGALEGSYERFYGQANLGLRFPAHPRIAARVVGVGFRLARVRGLDFARDPPRTPAPFRRSYAEPVVFGLLGNGPLRFAWQVGVSVPLRRYDPTYDDQWLYGHAGLRVAVNELID